MTATHTAAGGFRRALRLGVAMVALAALGAGVPWLLWLAAGGGLVPAAGPGGWSEVWAELQIGQLPEAAVTAVVVVFGWAVWLYLAVVVVDELRVGWRDRHQVTGRLDRLSEVSGFRQLVARVVGWLLAGHTMAASFLIAPSAGVFDRDARVVAVESDLASTGLIGLTSGAQRAAAAPAFDPHGYLDLAADPQPAAPEEATTAPADVIERVIEPGDNLWTIAEELTGDGFNYRAIWAATDLDVQDPPVDPTNPDLIFPGNVVRIPTSLIKPGNEIEAPLDTAPAPSADTGPAVEAATATDNAAVSTPPAPLSGSSVPGPAATDPDATSSTEPGAGPAPGDTEGFSSGASTELVAALGLGGAGGAVLLAGVARRRRRAMAASGRGQRPPRQHRAAARTSQRLQADLPAELWAPDDLVASWNSLHPADPGARQPWCVRWNSANRALECAWTPAPDAPAGAPSEPPQPGPASAWRLVVKHDRAGHPVPVWTMTEADIPATPNRLVVPAMVGCANGRRDRPSTDGFYINLEAVGIIAVESSNPELIEPEGVVRALLLQLQANVAAEVHLLDTDLGFDEVDHEIHADPMALENHLVAELTANQDLWDEADSMFALRSAGWYDGPTIVVVGPAEQLQHCSHLLSLARAVNVPLAVIALGPLSNAWATFLLEPEPDKHAIRFPAARAVLTFDHLSWVSTADAADLVELIAASSRPWRDPVSPTSVTAVDLDGADFDDVDGDDLGASAGVGPSVFLPPMAPASAEAHAQLWATTSTEGDDWPQGPTDFDDGTEAARVAELWDSLPEADPTSLADHPAGDGDGSDFDWAVPGDDDAIDNILGTSLDSLVDDGATEDRSPRDEDDDTGELVLADAATTGSGQSKGPAARPEARASALGSNGTRSAQSTLRLLHCGDDANGDDVACDPDGQASESEPCPSLVEVRWAAGGSGLRLELCGPIRLLRRSASGAGFEEVSVGGGSGLTGARLALLAYLAVAGRTSGGGVGREQIASEFWPEVHSDGTLREVRSDTVKRRVWELRKVLAEVAGVEDGRELLDGTDGRYGIGDIVCDWHELRSALQLAESHVAGSERWAEAVATMEGLVRAPGLLTPPGASRARSQFSWIDHYEARVQDMTRRVVTVLTDHARILNEAGRHREALQVLGTAREISDAYPRDVADGMVATYLALSDPALAERECDAYEALFDGDVRARERDQPPPGSPRARLDAYLGRRPT